MQKIKDLIYYNRKEIIICSILIFLFISYVLITSNEKTVYIEKENIVKNDTIEQPKEEVKKEIIIDIKGEVKSPGTYKLEEDERVIDAINKAGGLKDKADTSEINLSEKVYDEMVINIPNKEEEKKETTSIKSNTKKETSSNNKVSSDKISINNASLEELMTIKGIGKTKAEKIIEYRNKVGKFQSIDELTNVSGIGKTTLEKIKNYIKL